MSFGQVTYSTAVNLGDFTADGVYPFVLAPQSVLPAGPNTQYNGEVGGGAWGKVGVPLFNSLGAPIATPGDLYDAIGIPNASNPYDAGTAILLAMNADVQASPLFTVVRATDGTDTAAQIPIQDPGTSATGSITVGGTPASGNVVGVVFNPQTGTLTLTGTPTNGDTVTVTILAPGGAVVATQQWTISGSPGSLGAAATAGATFFNGNTSALQPFLFAVASGVTIIFYSLGAIAYGVSVAVAPGGAGHIGGTFGNAFFQQVSSSLPPVSVSVSAHGSGLGALSRKLQQAINASGAVIGPTGFLQTLNPSAATTFNVSALTPGSAGNSIVILGFVTTTGATVTMSPATPTTMSGGGVQGVIFVVNASCTGSRGNGGTATVSPSATYNPSVPIGPANLPAYDIVLTIPQAPNSEAFRNIPAWLLTTGTYSYDAPTFIANAISAINNGTPNGRGPSRYWTAAAYGGSVSSQTPWTAGSNTPTTLGTDGSSGLSPSQLLGTDGITPAQRTGMYGLRQTGVFQFSLAGVGGQSVADTAVAQAAYLFAVQELTYYIGPTLPIGTDAEQAVADRALYNFANIYGLTVKDWVYYRDPVLGTIIPKDPLGVALGIVSGQSPAESPGNKPALGANGVLYTEHTSSGAYTEAEVGLLAQAGITAVGQYLRAPLYTLIHGQNAAGSLAPGQGGANYTRLTNYIIRRLFQILTGLVDELQGSKPNDPTRVKAKNLADALGQSLMQSQQVVTWQTVVDGSNNTPVTIGQGLLIMYIVAEYYGTARFIVPFLEGGTNVSIATLQQSLAA